MGIFNWSKTAGSNTSPEGISIAEGMDPANVNNDQRAQYAALAEWRDDTGGALTTTGSGAAYSVATHATVPSSPADGVRIHIVAHATNTGTLGSTLAVDGVSSRKIRIIAPEGEREVIAGELRINGHYILEYDDSANGGSGAWVLLNPTPLAGGEVLLSRVVAASSANVDFDLDFLRYDFYTIRMHTVLADVDGAGLRLRVSTDSGASFISSSFYQRAATTLNSTTGTSSVMNDTTDSSIKLADGFSSITGENGAGYVNLYRTTRFRCEGRLVYTDNSTATLSVCTSAGLYNASGIDAVRLFMSSGTIATGTFQLFGYRY